MDTNETQLQDNSDEILKAQAWLDDEEAKLQQVVQEKMADAMTPGFWVKLDPDESDLMGAFVEDAISEQDAINSVIDLPARLNARAQED